jgi:multiple sugar transport system substrate-binding protein
MLVMQRKEVALMAPADRGIPLTRRTLMQMTSGTAALAAACARVGAPGPGEKREGIFKEKTVLLYQSYKNPEELAVFLQAVDRWVERTPNVEVRTDVVPQGEYIEKLLVRIAAGDPPDVMEVNDRMASDFIFRDTLTDLTPFIKKDNKEVDIDDFYPAYRQAMFARGKQWGIPDYCGPVVMYCNKALFDKAGIPYPDETWDWDRFLQAGRAITRDTDGDGRLDQFMTTNSLGASKSWTPYVWWSFGGDILEGAGPHHPNETKWLIDQPANAQAVQYWGDLIYKFNIIPYGEQTRGISFQNGRIATEIAGRWLVPPYKTQPWIQEGGVIMALPPKGIRPRRSRNSTLSATIPANARKPEAAWELVKFHTGKEGLTVALEGQRTMSPRKSLVEVFRKTLLPWESFEVYMKAQEYFTQAMPMNAHWEESERIFAEELNNAYQGKKPPAQALKDLQQRLTDLMKRGL